MRALTDAEALLWSLDSEPTLRAAFISVTFLDSAPDFARFRRRVSQAVDAIPALNHRVVSGTVGRLGPQWELDSEFDLDFHVRHVALPVPGSQRQVLDLAAAMCQDPLDRARPLWQFTVADGLHDGSSALIAKMHHVLSDGIGAVRMSAAFLDLSPEGDSAARRPRPRPTPVGPSEGAPPSGLARPIRLAQRVAAGAMTTALHPERLPRHASDSVALVRSLTRQFVIVDPAHSPLWAGRSSMTRRFETLSVELDLMRATAAKLGGTINDVFVTALAGAAGAYHLDRGVHVNELRMSMPVSTRTDHSVGGNAWAPSRVLVPAGERDPLARFAAVRERLEKTKREPALRLAMNLSGLFRAVPAPVVLRLVRQQVSTVDFACSNVRGAPFDLWVAGARVVATHPMGPTAGSAFNATVLSYMGSFDVGINIDSGAVDDPAELREHLVEVFTELADAAGL